MGVRTIFSQPAVISCRSREETCNFSSHDVWSSLAVLIENPTSSVKEYSLEVMTRECFTGCLNIVEHQQNGQKIPWASGTQSEGGKHWNGDKNGL